jgi:uncharacterized repeat protein (TIGR03803 family)
MTHKKRFPGLTHSSLLLAVVLSLIVPASAEWKEKVLYSFQGGANNGSVPVGGVVFDRQGNLYGVTSDGGGVYQLVPPAQKGGNWTESVLYVFQGNTKGDGANPSGGLVIDSAGNLYGVTASGGTGNCVLLGNVVGCGTVYELSPPAQKGGAWTETILYSIPTAKQGYLPNGNLVFDSAGNLYGATTFGGTKGTTCDNFYGGQCGVIFELSPPKQKGGQWTEKLLYQFAGVEAGKNFGDGAEPNGGLVLDSKGIVFGTTYVGGYNCPHNSNQGCGAVFELAPPNTKRGIWKETVLYRFKGSPDGGGPQAGLVFDGKGDLHGTTIGGGGGSGSGTVFTLSPKANGSWRERVLYSFQGQSDGAEPRAGVVFDARGNIFGTTSVGGAGQTAGGTMFELRQSGRSWSFAVLHTFTGNPDGSRSTGQLIFDTTGNLYGTTLLGGAVQTCQGGCGTVFEVSP